MVVVVFVENGGHGDLAAAPLAKALFEARFGIAPAPRRPGRCRRQRRRRARASRGRRAGRRHDRPRASRAAGGIDLVVLGCALALAALGVLFVASATTGTHFEGLAGRQAIWIARRASPRWSRRSSSTTGCS